jgi:peptidoglycan/LPS O-acetylase OafA/YrhL
VKLPVDRLFAAGVPTFVFFILIFKALQNSKIPKFPVILGNISYSLYLTHTFIITTFSKFIIDIDHKITVVSIIGLAFAISIVVGVAYISWYLIENKMTNWIKNALH